MISEPAFEERDGVWYTKFDISYTNAVGVSPVAVHFINEAASYDPALWTTVNFYGQKNVPVLRLLQREQAQGKYGKRG